MTSDPQLARRQRSVNVAAFAGAGNAISHLVVNAMHDFGGLMWVNAYNLAFTVLSLALPRLHRHGDNLAAFALIAMILAGNTFVVWALGTSSNLHIYLTFASAMLYFFGVRNWRLFLALFALVTIILLLTIHLAPVHGFIQPEDATLRAMLSQHALINTIVINAAMLFYALYSLDRAEAELENQYARSEALIETMMPAAIAARLKAGEARVADQIDTLSVLFADIVGFTEASRDLPPGAVVDYLDALVRDLDDLATLQGVEKIKTIGDSYMAAAGFDGDAAAGARAIARFALAMQGVVGKQPPLGGKKLSLRIGVNAGPVTAGIIGDARFSYDVWGSAVNIAARLESLSEPGRILASDAFHALTQDAFDYEARGPVDIRGIGNADAYFLVGRKT
ncbi:adenylate/guanylate cyclase domain-containing protein [Variibacter gotjawalensis]|nr:adenylate/guanylate cyclase domain-containing protein [Variibacter gotjawalensis]NIK50183.1 adenylate cyclase [Variibacter gotjawalensis]